MTDPIQSHPALIAGHVIGVHVPSQGQFEALLRLRSTLARGTDDDRHDFYARQIDRIGTLLESLIQESDRDLVDQLVLTGKVDMQGLMAAILAAPKPTEEVKPVVVKKAVKARAPRK